MLSGIAGALGLPSPGALVLLLALTIARPLGLLTGFSLIAWGMGQSVMLRIGFALALGLPTAVVLKLEIGPLLQHSNTLELGLTVLKEFLIGYGFGFLASLPILAYQYAGSTIDNYRGESAPGHTDPMGGSLGTWGLFFPIIFMLIFTYNGGLQSIVEKLYQTYELWPVISGVPALSNLSVSILLDQLQVTFQMVVVLMAPVLLVLLSIDFSLAIASRIAQRFQVMSIEFLIKNMVAVLLLPLAVIYIISQIELLPVDLSEGLSALRLILK